MPSTSSEADRLPGLQRGRGRERSRDGLDRWAAAVAASRAMVLAPRFDLAQEPLPAEHDAIRHHLALRDCGAETPGRAEQYVALGGTAEAAARGARGNKRLDQHGHRRVARIEAMVCHVAARVGGPQRRPAGAYRSEEICLVVEPEKALELSGEGGAGPVLDERRGSDNPEALPDQRAPGMEQRLEDRGNDRALIKLEPEFDRDPPRLERLGRSDAPRRSLEAELGELHTIRCSAQTKATRRRQPGAA
jgi:hypothetical protein